MAASEQKRSGVLSRGTRSVVSRERSWRVSIALLVCFGVAASGLHTVLQDFGWWFAIAGTVFAVLASAAVTRAFSRRSWLPTFVGVFVFIGLLTFFFARRTAFLFVIPTFDSLAAFGDRGQAGALSIAGQSVPAEATLGVVFLLCLGAGALSVAADFLAVTWRRPALAAIPLAILVAIPTFIGIQLADVFIFVLVAIAWLVLLRAGDPFPQTARAVGVGAAVVTATLVLPLMLPHVDESRATGDGFGGYFASVNPVLDLGQELRRGLPQTILTYSTQSGEPTYLRLVSLQNFLPDTWEPDPAEIDEDNAPSAVGPPPGLSAGVRVSDETTWVDVSNLGSPWLPVPYPATSISGLTGSWYWDAADLTFTSPRRVARGEAYRVESLVVNPTPAQLDAASAAPPELSPTNGDDPTKKYLALPANLPSIISDTAHTVTSSAANDYGRAVALQEYFRDGPFSYSETAPVDHDYDDSGMSAVAQFLEVKSGYCIHFASAMAVMARTLGIPSRVVVGFLPGTKEDSLSQGRTQYRVTTQNVHSWPELYFENIGWTRFEPTPGRGFVPSYADEATPGVPAPPNTGPAPTATPGPSHAPTESAVPREPGSQSPGSGSDAQSLGWLWAAIVLAAAALLLLSPAAVRVAQRFVRVRGFARGRPASATLWRELLQSAEDLGVRLSATATPRENAVAIARAGRLREADLAALDLVLGLVEAQSFARKHPEFVSGAGTIKHGAPGEWVERFRAIRAQLRAASGWRARLRGSALPRSLWRRDRDVA